MIVWRLAHDKIPAKLLIMSRGISLASICYLCNSDVESAYHMFFQCSFARYLWSWLRRKAWIHSNPMSLDDLFQICNSSTSNQYGFVLKVAIIFNMNQIWSFGIKFKNENMRPNRRNSINMI